MTKTKRRVFLAILVLLPFLGLEILARLYVWSREIPHHELVFDFSRSAFTPYPYLGYAPRRNFKTNRWLGVKGKTLTVNSLGFRGPELPEAESRRIRIVCLGGSTTMSTKVGDPYTYPRLLEGYLREI